MLNKNLTRNLQPMMKKKLPDPAQVIFLTAAGVEEDALLELQDYGVKAKAFPEMVSCSVDLKTLLTIAYTGHSFNRILLEMQRGSLLPFNFLLPLHESSNTISIEVIGGDKVAREEYRQKMLSSVAQVIPQPRFVFSNADIPLVILLGEEPIICLDAFQRDFSKRLYKVFLHRASLKASTALSALFASGYTGKKVLLDPFCGSGVIPIEAALYSRKFPLYYYDKHKLLEASIYTAEALSYLQTVDSAIKEKLATIYAYDNLMASVRITQKNAKIAGVEKNIVARRVSVDWMDIKIEEKSVDCIVTDPPRMSRNLTALQYKELMRLLFDRASLVLKPSGNVTVIVSENEIVKEVAKANSFVFSFEKEIHQGKERLFIIVLKRSG